MGLGGKKRLALIVAAAVVLGGAVLFATSQSGDSNRKLAPEAKSSKALTNASYEDSLGLGATPEATGAKLRPPGVVATALRSPGVVATALTPPATPAGTGILAGEADQEGAKAQESGSTSEIKNKPEKTRPLPRRRPKKKIDRMLESAIAKDKPRKPAPKSRDKPVAGKPASREGSKSRDGATGKEKVPSNVASAPRTTGTSKGADFYTEPTPAEEEESIKRAPIMPANKPISDL